MKKINPSKDSCPNFKRDNVDCPCTVPYEETRCYACCYNLFAVCWFDERNDAIVYDAISNYSHSSRVELLKRLKKGENRQ